MKIANVVVAARSQARRADPCATGDLVQIPEEQAVIGKTLDAVGSGVSPRGAVRILAEPGVANCAHEPDR